MDEYGGRLVDLCCIKVVFYGVRLRFEARREAQVLGGPPEPEPEPLGQGLLHLGVSREGVAELTVSEMWEQEAACHE